ncbi:MAG TPA: phytase [Dokdonella sp.]|uniref:phytase n=1 Tax=Dokdonella sp. TaxID=2291710 RepID=UPI0025C2A31F|nr:phytase [Dokdonella sp.]MBX3691642.1 phytase [Dokdonella sp.]HNR91712.1 phytase [Dokdonella sp.]
MPIRSLRLSALVALVVLSACAGRPASHSDPKRLVPMLAESGVAHVVVAEAFVSAASPGHDVDSPAAWRTDDGRVLLIATAKKSDTLKVYDGDSGTTLAEHGGPGLDTGRYARPNGIFTIADVVFVVERDNRRVQVLRLPGFEPIGQFGDAELRAPYGLWLRELEPARYEVIVSDSYIDGIDARGEAIPPPLAELDGRLRRYEVSLADGSVEARHLADFGDTTAQGAIRLAESVWGDPAHDRLLVSEEDVATGTALREYGFDGRYRRTFGLGLFKAQSEGIALWACDDGSGYWIATDQYKDHSLFHVFDRASLVHLGAFAGNTIANTDGVWLHQAATARFPAGVFYAVHDDRAVGAFDWRDIARALQLRERCE